MRNRQDRISKLQKRLDDQRQWITDHGTTLTTYIERYGEPGAERCYGDGGRAIYEADTAALKDIEDELRLLGAL